MVKLPQAKLSFKLNPKIKLPGKSRFLIKSVKRYFSSGFKNIKKSPEFFWSHKKLSISLMVLIVFVAAALDFRGNSIAQFKKNLQTSNNYTVPNIFQVAVSAVSSPAPEDTPLPSGSSVLGTSTKSDNYVAPSPYTAPPPAPVANLTPTPEPVVPPSSSSSSSSSPSASSCGGTPTAYNSEAMVGSSNTQTGSSVTIEIQLLDCHNNYANVNDNLTVTLSSGDSATTINGSASPVKIQAQNGKASFSVSSPNATTAIFTVRDTDRNFNVTDPHNQNPKASFGAGSTCRGIPTVFYSEAFSSSSSDSSGNIQVELRDCNNNLTSVADTLTLSLSNSDPTLLVNNQRPSITIVTTNGKAYYSLYSQIHGSDTFVIQDTTRGFSVTDPHNHNPAVSFNVSSSSNTTPSSSPVPTATPTTASPSPVPTATPTPSTPIPSPSPHPSASPG